LYELLSNINIRIPFQKNSGHYGIFGRKRGVISILSNTEQYLKKLIKIESLISDAFQGTNKSKVLDNFKDNDGSNGNLSHQGVWKLIRNISLKSNPPSQLVRNIWEKNSLLIQKSSTIYTWIYLDIDLDKDQQSQFMRLFKTSRRTF
jgi:hypothetical protein